MKYANTNSHSDEIMDASAVSKSKQAQIHCLGIIKPVILPVRQVFEHN